MYLMTKSFKLMHSNTTPRKKNQIKCFVCRLFLGKISHLYGKELKEQGTEDDKLSHGPCCFANESSL